MNVGKVDLFGINSVNGIQSNERVAYAPNLKPLGADTVAFNKAPVRDYVAEKKASLAKIQNELGESIAAKDANKIFEYFGIQRTENEDGKVTLSEFKQPNFLVTFSDIGVNEDELLAGVTEIEGDADFRHSAATDLGKLERIGGEADFKDSKVTDLSSLREIDGDAWFTRAAVQDLGALETVKGDLWTDWSEITDLHSLKSIGGNVAYFTDSKVTDLSSLQSINGEAHFFDSKVKELPALKTIGYGADFRRSELESLPALESIGGYTYFDHSKVSDISSLKSVDGGVRISNTPLTKEDFKDVKVNGKIDDKPYSLNPKIEINPDPNHEIINGF